MSKDISYQSKDQVTQIHAHIWEPSGEVKAIIQIVHGMNEYIERYEKVANIFNKQGILVCGEDHLGHGQSVIDKDHRGYFAKDNASEIVVDDVYTLTETMQKEYPNVPYFIVGHSMGSFITRNYITKYGDKINGTVIMGTGYHNKVLMSYAKCMARIIKFYKGGWFHRSRFLYKTTNGGFNKYFEDKENPFCWLTRDKEVLANYANDPMVKFRFTCNAYYTIFDWIQKGSSKKLIKKIPKDLPILIISGKDDPVGNFGKDIYKLNKIYNSCGLKKVKMRLYKGMRHEIFNELDNVVVYDDIIKFISENVKKKASE